MEPNHKLEAIKWYSFLGSLLFHLAACAEGGHEIRGTIYHFFPAARLKNRNIRGTTLELQPWHKPAREATLLLEALVAQLIQSWLLAKTVQLFGMATSFLCWCHGRWCGSLRCGAARRSAAHLGRADAGAAWNRPGPGLIWGKPWENPRTKNI